MLLAATDLILAALISTTNTWMPAAITTFVTIFLTVKGVTTITGPPIWFGPLAFLAGIIDLTTGITLYYELSHAGITGQLYTLTTGIAIVKGFLTVSLGLIM